MIPVAHIFIKKLDLEGRQQQESCNWCSSISITIASNSLTNVIERTFEFRLVGKSLDSSVEACCTGGGRRRFWCAQQRGGLRRWGTACRRRGLSAADGNTLQNSHSIQRPDDHGPQLLSTDEATVGAMCEVACLEMIEHLSHLIGSAAPVLQLLLTSLHAMQQLLLTHHRLQRPDNRQRDVTRNRQKLNLAREYKWKSAKKQLKKSQY